MSIIDLVMTTPIMNLNAEQEQALQKGHSIEVNVAGAQCVLLRKDIFEQADHLDYSAWTQEEMDLLAAEGIDTLAGDGLDEDLT